MSTAPWAAWAMMPSWNIGSAKYFTSSTMTSAPQFLSSVIPSAKLAMPLEALWKARSAPGARSWTISPRAAPSSVSTSQTGEPTVQSSSSGTDSGRSPETWLTIPVTTFVQVEPGVEQSQGAAALGAAEGIVEAVGHQPHGHAAAVDGWCERRAGQVGADRGVALAADTAASAAGSMPRSCSHSSGEWSTPRGSRRSGRAGARSSRPSTPRPAIGGVAHPHPDLRDLRENRGRQHVEAKLDDRQSPAGAHQRHLTANLSGREAGVRQSPRRQQVAGRLGQSDVAVDEGELRRWLRRHGRREERERRSDHQALCGHHRSPFPRSAHEVY